MSTNHIHVGIIGGGAVAHALSAALRDALSAGLGQDDGAALHSLRVWARCAAASASVAALGASSSEAVEDLADLSSCDVLLIAVSDAALDAVASQLSKLLGPSSPNGRAVFHTSGASTGADALRSMHGAASSLGSLHPLVAVASDRAPGPNVFQDRPFMLEATSASAVLLGQSLVRAMGGFEVQLPAAATPEDASEHKARYHALATMVATGVVTLVDRAAQSMAHADPGARARFRQAYGALAESAVQNVLRGDGARVLTGAIARGDEPLVARHRAALEGDASAPIYRAVEVAARRMLQDHGSNPSPATDEIPS